MVFVWTEKHLLDLAPNKLETLRKNALAKNESTLATLCATIQANRKAETSKPTGAVIGFHFVCESDYEVTFVEGGNFWSGVWVVNESHLPPAISLGGYVALHKSKAEHSYRQGKIVGWKSAPRSLGSTSMGISFLLEPLGKHFEWFGGGSGEKGYRRIADEPRWTGL